MTSHLTWYVARAGGLVAWGLATGSVMLGLALSTRLLGPRPRPAWLYDLHRYLGGLALIFTGLHVLAILLDRYVRFGLVNVLVPFTGSWHPAAVAWGILALYLLLAVELTSLARSRLPLRLWRRVHLGAFAVFALSTVHGLSAGSDTMTGPVRWLMIGASLVVLVLTMVRMAGTAELRPSAPRGPRRFLDLRGAVPVRPDVGVTREGDARWPASVVDQRAAAPSRKGDGPPILV